MSQKTYTMDDTNRMNWEEFGEILNALIQTLSEYQKSHHMTFDIVAPILRNGGVAATAIANKLQIMRFLPIQVKYIYNENSPTTSELKQLLSIPDILQDTPDKPNILVCENNTGTGKSAQRTVALIKQKYPDSKIYYATVAKVYGGPDSFEDVQEYFWGIQTNELFKADDDEVVRLGLRPKITIFPWETTAFELTDVIADLAMKKYDV